MRCRRGDRCLDRAPVPGTEPRQYEGAQLTEPGGLCRTDLAHVRAAITALPGDYAELSLLLDRSGGAGLGAPVSGSRELPVPIRLGVEALQARIDQEVSWWAESLCRALHVEWAFHTARTGLAQRPGPRVQRGVDVLIVGFRTLLDLPVQVHEFEDDGVLYEWPRDGVDGALALLDLHRRTADIAGRTDKVDVLPTPCPQCGLCALVRKNGQENIECRHCLTVLRPAEYRAHTSILAADYADDYEHLGAA